MDSCMRTERQRRRQRPLAVFAVVLLLSLLLLQPACADPSTDEGNSTTNSTGLPSCVYVVGSDTFDLRAIAGTYEAEDNQGSNYRYALCTGPLECNGITDTAVCQRLHLLKKFRIEASLENGLGRLPASSVTVRPDNGALRIAYGFDTFDAILKWIQQAGTLVTAAMESEFPNSADANATAARIAEAEDAVRRLRRSSVVSFVCEPNGTRQALPVFRFVEAAYTNSTEYRFELRHACACANASCPPPPPPLPRPLEQCAEDWRFYILHNYPAAAVFIILVVYQIIHMTVFTRTRGSKPCRCVCFKPPLKQRQHTQQHNVTSVNIDDTSDDDTQLLHPAKRQSGWWRSKSGGRFTRKRSNINEGDSSDDEPLLPLYAPISTQEKQQSQQQQQQKKQRETCKDELNRCDCMCDCDRCCGERGEAQSWWASRPAASSLPLQWLPVPINFLQRRHGRLVCALIFGGFSSVALGSLLELAYVSSSTSVYGSGSLLEGLWVVVCMGLLFYPIALCRECNNHLLGSLLGLAYTTLALGYYMQPASCLVAEGVSVQAARFLPTFGCLVALILIFLVDFLRILRAIASSLLRSILASRTSATGLRINWHHIARQIMVEEDPWQGLECYELRVRELLVGVRRGIARAGWAEAQCQREPWLLRAGRRVCGKLVVYRSLPFFRYSPRVLCMVTVAALFLYQMLLLWLPACAAFADAVHSFMDTLRCQPERITIALSKLPFVHNTPIDVPAALAEAIPAADLALDIGLSCRTDRLVHSIVRYCLGGAGVFSGLLQLAFLLHMLACYRKHLCRLYAGDHSFLPAKRAASSVAIVDALKYGGFQVAYTLWAWIIMTLMISIVCLFITFAVVLPAIRILPDWLWMPFVLPHIWPLAVSLLLYVVQLVLVRVFMQAPDGAYSVVNQRLFHTLDYFLFFINIFVGVYSFVLRLSLNMVHGLVFISRLDKSMLGRGYELLDPGYRTYVGFLLLENSYSNPTAMTFVRLLAKSVNPTAGSVHSHCVGNSGRGGDDDDDGEDEDNGDVACSTNPIVAATACQADATKELGSAAAQQCMDARQKLRRNRWCLYVTLINNPGLRRCRKWNVRRQALCAAGLRAVESQIWSLEQRQRQPCMSANTSKEVEAAPAAAACVTCGGTSPSRPSSTLTVSSGFDYYPIVREYAQRQANDLAHQLRQQSRQMLSQQHQQQHQHQQQLRRGRGHRRTQSDDLRLSVPRSPGIARPQLFLGSPRRRVHGHHRSVSFGSDLETIKLAEDDELVCTPSPASSLVSTPARVSAPATPMRGTPGANIFFPTNVTFVAGHSRLPSFDAHMLADGGSSVVIAIESSDSQ